MCRYRTLLLALVGALFMTGCAQAQADVKTNTVGALALTDREQTLVELVGEANQNVAFLAYELEQPYGSMTAWLECYQDGVLIDVPLALSLISGEESASGGGLAAVTISPKLWTLAVASDQGARYTQSAPPSADLEGYAMAVNLPQEPLVFAMEETVVMAAYLYNQNALSVGSLSELAEPANLTDYACALVLKARFSLSKTAVQEVPTVEASEPPPEPEPEETAAPSSEAESEASGEVSAPLTKAEVLNKLADSVTYNRETGELALTIPEGLADIEDSLFLHVNGRVRMGEEDRYRSWHAFEQESDSYSWTPGKTYAVNVPLWQIDFLEVTMSFLPQKSEGEARNDTILVQVNNKGEMTRIVPKDA